MISTLTNCRGHEGQLQSSQQAGDRPCSPGPWRRTTKLYNRTGDESMLDEVKWIMISGFMPLCRWAGQKSADHICIDKICFGGVPIGADRDPPAAGPFCHCRERYERNLRPIHASSGS
jgi:hypothetical protein